MFGFIPAPLQLWALLGLVIASLAIGAGTMHQVDNGRYNALVAKDAKALAHAEADARKVEQAQADVGQKSGAHDAAAQVQIQTRTVTLTKEIPVYVTAAQDHDHCVTWGVVRVYDAAVLGLDASQTGAPAGQPDDACSTVKPSDLAANAAANYGAARANAQQLNDLEDDVRQRTAAANAVPY